MLSLREYDNHDSHVSFGSRRPHEGRLQLMKELGEAQPRRVVLVVDLMAMVKDFLFRRGGTGKPTPGCHFHHNYDHEKN